MNHSFHIPVMGIAFTIDTPLKIAHLGISSVISLADDMIIERMREFYYNQNNIPYQEITKKEVGHRSMRITSYLNILHQLIIEKTEKLKAESFEQKGDLVRYFELLSEKSPLKQLYKQFLEETNPEKKKEQEQELRSKIVFGSIDVNIMSKLDKLNKSKQGDVLNSDALEALKGFAESTLSSSVVISAGLNPKLFSYIENFPDFFPDSNGFLKKKIILKVSDYRSALIQAKVLAKKGIWVSEFRIESGLNCGGHAFATEGILTGPILEEFKQNRFQLAEDLFDIYTKALDEKGCYLTKLPKQIITYQGGIGTHQEDEFLREYYQLDATGWGSPFLLVPEITTVDEETLNAVSISGKDDFYVSGSSPLGVPFNNFRLASNEVLRLERIAKGRPGSPCIKRFLVSNTEFTTEPICTASREYQHLKLKQLDEQNLPEEEYKEAFDNITEKTCLCEGLSASALVKNNIAKPKERVAISICPGPNIAYFKGVFSLEQLVKHIYGEENLLKGVERSNVFINELHLYLEYLKKDISTSIKELTDKKMKHFNNFKNQLEKGLQYYRDLIPQIYNQTGDYLTKMKHEVEEAEEKLNHVFSRLVGAALVTV
ncbi:MAG TPA: hypothetical protein PKX92_02740 [Edaphocola sp.]|nr:hypothetical protein [Edaphocola sp.]